MKEAEFKLQIHLMQNNTRLKVSISEFSLYTTRSNFEIILTGSFGDTIVTFIINALKYIFLELIENYLNSIGKEAIVNGINKVLSELPDDIIYEDDIALKYVFTSQPVTNNNSMTVPVFLYSHIKDKKEPPIGIPPDIPDHNDSCKKGTEVFVSDFVINNTLNVFQEAQKLIYEKVFEIMNFKIKFVCSIEKFSDFNIIDKIFIKGNTFCNGSIISTKSNNANKIKSYVSFIAELATDFAEKIHQGKIYMEIGQLLIVDLKIIESSGFNNNELKELLNGLLADFKREINEKSGKNGILLPSLFGIDLSELEQSVHQRFISFCVPLKLNSTLPSSYSPSLFFTFFL